MKTAETHEQKPSFVYISSSAAVAKTVFLLRGRPSFGGRLLAVGDAVATGPPSSPMNYYYYYYYSARRFERQTAVAAALLHPAK